MKILHCADIHLGSKMEAKFTRDKSTERKTEVMHTFRRMVEYANENDIKIILLVGDVFDKDNPAMKYKGYFYDIIKNHPQIDFLYLNGNHDKEGSYIEENIENLKTFNKSEFTYYEYDNICIGGIEMEPANAKSFYSQLSLDKEKINIVMLHGDATDSVGMDKIKIANLKNKGIDDLALGHIHTYKYGKIDERGIYAFPGCLEGRGFDECGEKGFIVLDIEKTVDFKFVPFARRTIHEVSVDITNANSLYEVEEFVKKEVQAISKDDILRINLTGEVSVDLELSEKEVENSLSSYYFVNVKNKTTLKTDISDYDGDQSLIGEFIRNVSGNDEYSEEDKQKIITMGLRLINGKEVE